MRIPRPALPLLLILGTACASGGASEIAMLPEGRGIKMYTAIATAVPVSPDSAYRLLIRVYTLLELPMVSVDAKRAVGNDELKVRRRIAGLPMQDVLDCGEKLGLQNAETWDIHMNLLSYVNADPAGGSQVLTRVQATGSRPEGSSLRQTPCATKGELEKKIGEMVTKLAAGN
jgi:hypothetical protein